MAMIRIYNRQPPEKKVLYFMANSVEWDEDKHPRAADGKFGSGGSKGESKEDNPKETVSKEKSKSEEIKPQTDIPKPLVQEKMGQKFFEDLLQDIYEYGKVEDDNEYKVDEFNGIIKKLKANGIDHVDAYHVTDMKSSSEGITGSSVDPSGGYGENIRESSVYMFFDPDDIDKGYQGIMGAKNPENTVMHIKIPIDKLITMKGDGLFNMTYGTYSAVRIPGDVPSEWIDGMYKYKDEKENSTGIKVYRHA